jgi:hypothetical protein
MKGSDTIKDVTAAVQEKVPAATSSLKTTVSWTDYGLFVPPASGAQNHEGLWLDPERTVASYSFPRSSSHTLISPHSYLIVSFVRVGETGADADGHAAGKCGSSTSGGR